MKSEKTLHYHNIDFSLSPYSTLPFELSTRFISKSGDARIYKDVILLTPGDWTDSQTRAPVRYTKDLLMEYHNKWTRNYLNLDHMWTALNRIGWVMNPRCLNDGTIIGDLKISKMIQNGKDIVESIESGLINEVSVELLSEDVWDSEEGIRMASDIEFIGCAIISDGACENTRIVPDDKYGYERH